MEKSKKYKEKWKNMLKSRKEKQPLMFPSAGSTFKEEQILLQLN